MLRPLLAVSACLLPVCCTLPTNAAAARPGPVPVAGPAGDVDLRPQFAAFNLPPRPQGARPTCSIFTTVAAIEFAFARATGRGERLSADYCNWAANAANARHDDGDFFHFALSGFVRFGICSEAAWPYAAQFRGDELPPPDALVDAGRHDAAQRAVRVRWIRPIAERPGLSDAEFDEVLATLRLGWPVAAGSGHSRLLVGYRVDATADGGGVFLTLDSALARFAEVPAAFVRTQLYDVFVVETAA